MNVERERGSYRIVSLQRLVNMPGMPLANEYAGMQMEPTSDVMFDSSRLGRQPRDMAMARASLIHRFGGRLARGAPGLVVCVWRKLFFCSWGSSYPSFGLLSQMALPSLLEDLKPPIRITTSPALSFSPAPSLLHDFLIAQTINPSPARSQRSRPSHVR